MGVTSALQLPDRRLKCSSDLYRKFSFDLVSRLNSENSLLYDIAYVPSYSSTEIFEYNHANDHPELEQVDISVERSGNIQIFFEIYSGSIPDVLTLNRKKLNGSTINESEGFLEKLSCLKNYTYISGVSRACGEPGNW